MPSNMSVTELYVILELWDGRVSKKHVYLSKQAFEKGKKLHLAGLRFEQQSLEWYSGKVTGFKKGKVTLV